MNSDEIYKARIEELYEHILDKVKDGYAYGRRIDITNEHELIACAYLLGKSEELVLNFGDRKMVID